MSDPNPLAPVLGVTGARVTRCQDLSLEGGRLVSAGVDPWVELLADEPARVLVLRCELDEGATAGPVVLYLADEGEGFTAERAVVVPVEGPSTTRLVCLDRPACRVRLDPADHAGALPLAALALTCLPGLAGAGAALAHVVPPARDGIVVLTHQLDNSGAPILALNVARSLAVRGRDVLTVALCGGRTPLRDRYDEEGLALVGQDLVAFEGPQVEEDRLRMAVLAAALADAGYRRALLNTVVSAAHAGAFKQAGLVVACLLHETAHTICLSGWEGALREAALLADALVVPTESVCADVRSLVRAPRGRLVVRPQGVYLTGLGASEAAADEVLAGAGLVPGQRYVLCSGSINLRKGIDLFVAAAAALHETPGFGDLRFLWLGDVDGPTGPELADWVGLQVARGGLAEVVRVAPFADARAYKSVLARATAFWSTSRDDTFPSVVLEAMEAGVPVCAFEGASGVDTMLADGRGVLVGGFSPAGLARQTAALLADGARVEAMVARARAWVREELDFEAYVGDLEAILDGGAAVDPAWAQGLLPEAMPPAANPPVGAVHDAQAVCPAPAAQGGRGLRARLRALAHGPREGRPSPAGAPVLLDVSIGSDNTGDQIVMEACARACSEALGRDDLGRLPTHVYDPGLEGLAGRLAIVCGTNLVYTHMEESVQWALPRDLGSFDDLCLLGVGMQDLRGDEPFSPYSVDLLHRLLDGPRLHSVRDSLTERRLRQIGIQNVVNTGCPTMWGLTPAHCEAIPTGKARAVVATLTDYASDPGSDALLLRTLQREYEQVFLWVQGRHDLGMCVLGACDPTAVTLLPRSLAALDEVLARPDVDYVGTRLHAGIRALCHGRRALVVAVDGRARAIAADTGLSVIGREGLADGLREWICGGVPTRVRLPEEAIARWKAQFGHA